MECGDKEKFIMEKVIFIIEKLGGNVYIGDVEKVVDVLFVLLYFKKN